MNNCVTLKVDNLVKNFPTQNTNAIDNLSFWVESGSFFGIIGADASGKTTLMRILSGIMDFDSGNVKIFGKNIKNNTLEIQKKVSYMPQRFGLYEKLTVIENINLYSELRNFNDINKNDIIEELLKITKLSNFKNRFAGALSGGMKQKLALICTVIGNSELLLLDEVSVGVDPIARKELMSIVKEVMKKHVTVIWSTSYLDEASECDKVLLLDIGKSIFFGSPNEFLKKSEKNVFLLDSLKNEKINRNLIFNLEKQDNILNATIYNDKLRVLVKNEDLIEKERFSKHKIYPSIDDSFLINMSDKISFGSDDLFELYKDKKNKNKREYLIEAFNLTKEFGSFVAVNNLNFKVKRGEIFGLLGPNGAGKSTTFKMLCGLLTPTKGYSEIEGINLFDRKQSIFARKRIGYIAQKFSLYSEIKIIDNLNFFAGVYGLEKNVKKEAIDLVVNIFKLERFLNQNPSEVPLGIKQRLAFASAVMHKPDVLFLDEITSGADPIARKEFWNYINIFSQQGVSVVLTTHFMDEAEYCDNISIIYQGNKIAEGSPKELKQSSKNAVTFEDVFIDSIKKYDTENGKNKN